MELLLPTLRADFRMVETYRPGPGPQLLDLPVWAAGGECDAEVAESQISAWGETTSGAFSHQMFPGGHFFLNSHRSELLAALVPVLNRALP